MGLLPRLSARGRSIFFSVVTVYTLYLVSEANSGTTGSVSKDIVAKNVGWCAGLFFCLFKKNILKKFTNMPRSHAPSGNGFENSVFMRFFSEFSLQRLAQPHFAYQCVAEFCLVHWCACNACQRLVRLDSGKYRSGAARQRHKRGQSKPGPGSCFRPAAMCSWPARCSIG